MVPPDIFLFNRRENPRICKTANEDPAKNQGMAVCLISKVKTRPLQMVFKSVPYEFVRCLQQNSYNIQVLMTLETAFGSSSTSF